MSFIDDLMTKDTELDSYSLDYDLMVVPWGEPPEFERLNQLQNPGDRCNPAKILRSIGARPTHLEVHYSHAGLPFILPAVDPVTGLPSSLMTVELDQSADLKTVLYDYIENSKTRGNPAVLEDLFIFERIPEVAESFFLGEGFEFSPSSDTLQYGYDQEMTYNSIIEKVIYNDTYGLFATFHVQHEVNLLQEIMGFTLRYWIHDADHHLTPENIDRRPVYGEFVLQRSKRGGRLRLEGSVGSVDVQNGNQFKPWVNFDHDGALIHAIKNEKVRDKKDRHIYHCDFGNTLKRLVDMMSDLDDQQFYTLGKLGYLKLI